MKTPPPDWAFNAWAELNAELPDGMTGDRAARIIASHAPSGPKPEQVVGGEPLCQVCGDTKGTHHMGGNEHTFVPEHDSPVNEDAAPQSVRFLDHKEDSVELQATKLCWQIEKMGASEELTTLSDMATTLAMHLDHSGVFVPFVPGALAHHKPRHSDYGRLPSPVAQQDWAKKAARLATTLSEMASMEHNSVSHKRLLEELAEQAGALVRHAPAASGGEPDWRALLNEAVVALERYVGAKVPSGKDSMRRQVHADVGAHQLCIRIKNVLSTSPAPHLKETGGDSVRLDLLQTLIRECPHAKFFFSDDDANEEPMGFSVEIDGCDPLLIAAPTLREVIDKLAAETGVQSLAHPTPAKDEPKEL